MDTVFDRDQQQVVVGQFAARPLAQSGAHALRTRMIALGVKSSN